MKPGSQPVSPRWENELITDRHIAGWLVREGRPALALARGIEAAPS